MSGERDRLLERRELVARDLEELDLQVEEGEVDAATADGLRGAYRSELERIDADLARLAPARPKRETAPPARPASTPAGARAPRTPRPRSTRRVVVGALLILAALTAAVAFAARDAEPDQTVAAGPGELTVDPATVSDEELERVVAANPGITAMRMALADRYFEREDFSSALGHYLFIAENTTSPAEESKALTRVGWMAYITDQAEAADQYLDRALEANPDNSEAILYRGFVTLYGLEDAESAIPQLEAALRLDNISDNVVGQIEQALADARSGGTP